MRFRNLSPKSRLNLAAAALLVVGLGISAFIYLTAADVDTFDPLGNPLDESKSYRRSLEMYGGKANLLASEFTQWFGSLWHGKTLGLTLVVLTILVAAGIAFFARSFPSDPD